MKNGEKSLAKVFEILEVIGRSRNGLRASDVVAALELPASTVCRMLKFLADQSYLRKDGTAYMLGSGILRLGGFAREQNPLVQLARPFLAELSDATGETVHLAELRGVSVVYLDKKEGCRSIRMGSMIGKTSPCYCTGVGKAILAFLPSAIREKRVREIVFSVFTPRTISCAEQLGKELGHIHEQGYAIDDGEHETGVFCVAAPILDGRGEAIAGISVSGAEVYLKNNVAEIIRQVTSISSRLSGKIEKC